MTTTLKSVLNVTWKAGVGLIGLTVLGLGILIAETWYDNTYSRSYHDRTLSKNIKVEAYNNNRVRVLDTRTGKYTTPKVKWVSGAPQRDSLTVFCDKDDRRGFLNAHTGKIDIPARYARAWQFSDGLAFVVLPGSDSLSIIDHTGNIVHQSIAPYTHGEDYVFDADGFCEIGNDDYRGILRADGTWALEMHYLCIQMPNTDGYRIAWDEQGSWLFDAALNPVFNEPFDDIDFVYGQTCGKVFLTKNHRKQLCDYDGTVLEPFIIDGTYDLKYIVKHNGDNGENEYAIDPDLVVYRVDNWEGLMDKHTGRAITPAIYSDFNMISKNLIRARVTSSYDSESVVMDRKGRIII